MPMGAEAEIPAGSASGLPFHARLEAVAAEMEELAALARRLGAHLHVPNIRREVGKLVAQNLQELLAGKPPARPAAMLARLAGLARRLGMELDLWDAQNKLWAWAGSARLTIDREVAAELARNFWFDERTLLSRAGYTA